MKLNKILKACNLKIEVSENLNYDIKGIAIHSGSVKENYIFGAKNLQSQEQMEKVVLQNMFYKSGNF